MITNRAATIATCALLGGTVAVSFLLPTHLGVPGALAAPADPNEIVLRGILRDFPAGHADFGGPTPINGPGHYAGNVAPALATDRRPVFVEADPGAPGGVSGYIARWRLDEASGTHIADDEGANDGTLLGGATWVAGQQGGAVHFDGTNDYIEIPSSPEMQVTGDITFSGWFRLDADFDASSPTTLVIMEKFLDTEHDFHIGLTGNDYNRPEVPKGTLVFKVENGPTSDYYRYKWTNTASWQAGRWYHFACTLASADTAGNVIFIDGVDDTSSTDAGGVGFVDTGYDAPMRIGGMTVDYNGTATDIHFAGAIDDIMIYDRALTEADFAAATGGYKVSQQWLDAAGRNIAPHHYGSGVIDPLADGARVLLVVQDDVTLTGQDAAKKAVLESWGHTVSVIDDQATQSEIDLAVLNNDVVYISEEVSHDNVGSKYMFVPIGVVNEDKDLSDAELGFSASKRTWTGTTITILDNTHEITDGFPLGDLVVTSATWNFHRADGTVAPGGLALGRLPSHSRPALMVVEAGDELRGGLAAPNRRVRLPWGNHSVDFNTINAAGLTIMQRAVGWAAAGNPAPPADRCGNLIADTAGVASVSGDGAITSAATFDEWFRDLPGLNESKLQTVTLTDDGTGVYEYLDDQFHPVDGELLGNESDSHNSNFTYAIVAEFTYDECAGQFLEFEGGDGAWAFIDGSLVIDLGGLVSDRVQYAALDRLDLVDGETYKLHVFYAQRHATSHVFRLRTNLLLDTDRVLPAVTMAYD